MNKPISGFTPEVEHTLLSYGWPGNVRELENLVEMLVVMRDEGYIELTDLPPKLTQRSEVITSSFERELLIAGSYQEMVNRYEKLILQAALEKTGGVKSRAAKLLKIKRTTLTERSKTGIGIP